MGRVYSILEEMRNFHNILKEQGLTIDTSMPILIGDLVWGGGMCNVPRSLPEL